MVTIHTLGVNDKADVVDFLRKYFYSDEPIHKALQITDILSEDYWYTKKLGDGCSFKVVNEAGEIVAMKLNGFKHRNEQMHFETSDPKSALSYRLRVYIKSKIDVFDLVEPSVDRMLEGKVMAVRPDFRNQGLANILYNETTAWMSRNGIKYMVTTCSSHYTAMACQKMGFAEVFALKYTDFMEDGISPIVPEMPHTHLKYFLTTVEV